MEEVKKIWRTADSVMFDVDSTVVTEEGIDELAKFCGKGTEISKITVEAMNMGLDYREALKLRLEMMALTEQQLNDFLREHPISFTPGIENLVKLLKQRNVDVYLVSGGFRRIIEPIRQRLELPEENVFANSIFFTAGKYTGFDINEPTSRNGGKAEVASLLKKKFGYKRLVMIGDGATDAEACPPADAFIGFGGNVVRESVKAKAKWFVTSFQEIIDELNMS
ncbi:hypothetical protein RUM44_007729 [Polyplax serrata]|uniref:Phosphoserine phosphatase n=1 Tax=Polyplax serrata TaxID=468196 RepID=A0ABR1B855_POLSC